MVHQRLVILRTLFYSLTQIKNKAALTSQGFEKLLNKPAISNVMSRNDLQIAFQRGSAGQKFIDLVQFCKLILQIYQQHILPSIGAGIDQPTFGSFVDQLME